MVNALRAGVLALATLAFATLARGQDEGLVVDAQAREVRVLCEALRAEYPLEYICVVKGTADHEAVVRTRVRPSAVHAALLGLGLEPGRPLRYDATLDQWFAPSGPPLYVDVEWTDANGSVIRKPVGELLRSRNSGEPRPRRPFVFVGSLMYQGDAGPTYAADATGQLVSLVNWEHTTIDVGEVKGNATEELEWEINPDTAPPDGAECWMILVPVAAQATQPTTLPTTATTQAADNEVATVLVSIDAGGVARVDHVETDAARIGEAVLAREVEGATVAVRLGVTRGTPTAPIGRAIGSLVAAGVTDVTFAPAEARGGGDDAVRQQLTPAVAIVHEGGREVTFEGVRSPLGEFVRRVGELPEGDRAQLAVRVRAQPGAGDIKRVDLAAPAAVLYALGYGHVEVETLEIAVDPIEAMRREWERRVMPQADALRTAAQTHYDVMQAYQREINRLLDEADKLRREMDELQRRFDELTTPQPTLPAPEQPNGADGDAVE